MKLEGSAQISEDGKYRYTLSRTWDNAKPILTWIMLNPSTADAEQDDPTIRRCINFSKAWGYGGIVVVNLFAFRATDPKKLPSSYEDAIGIENDGVISINTLARDIVCAWGSNGSLHGRAYKVTKHLIASGKTLHCLGFTKDGSPKHPLYVKGDVERIAFGTTEEKTK